MATLLELRHLMAHYLDDYLQHEVYRQVYRSCLVELLDKTHPVYDHLSEDRRMLIDGRKVITPADMQEYRDEEFRLRVATIKLLVLRETAFGRVIKPLIRGITVEQQVINDNHHFDLIYQLSQFQEAHQVAE